MLEKLYKVAICEELENEFLVNLVVYNDTAFNYNNKRIIKNGFLILIKVCKFKRKLIF
jgi:hypothetical protein